MDYIYQFIPIIMGFLMNKLTGNDIGKLSVEGTLQPPGEVFGIVWTTLYLITGKLFVTVKNDVNDSILKKSFLGLTGLQVFLENFWIWYTSSNLAGGKESKYFTNRDTWKNSLIILELLIGTVLANLAVLSNLDISDKILGNGYLHHY